MRPPTLPVRSTAGDSANAIAADLAGVKTGVVYAVDNPAAPAVVSILENDTWPPVSGYQWPATIKTTFSEAPNPFVAPPTGQSYWINHVTLTGGTEVQIDTVNRVVINALQGYSTLAPYNYQNDYQNIKHNGGVGPGGWNQPQPIDQSQLATIPTGQAAPVISPTTPTITYPVVGNGTYDAQATFTVDVVGGLWQVGLALFAVPHGTSLTGLDVREFSKGFIAVGQSTSGTYTVIWKSLGAGQSEDLYIAYEAPDGSQSPVRLVGTTAANPIGTTGLGDLSGTTPVEASSASALTYFNVGTAAVDAESTVHLDSNGTSTNKALAEIEAVMCPYYRLASQGGTINSTSDGWVPAGAPIAVNGTGNYVCTWGQLPAGASQALGVRYVGHNGKRSNVLILSEINPTVAQPMDILEVTRGIDLTPRIVLTAAPSFTDHSTTYDVAFPYDANTGLSLWTGVTAINFAYRQHGLTSALIPISTVSVSGAGGGTDKTGTISITSLSYDPTATWDLFAQYVLSTGPTNWAPVFTTTIHSASTPTTTGSMPGGTTASVATSSLTQLASYYLYQLAFTLPAGFTHSSAPWLTTIKVFVNGNFATSVPVDAANSYTATLNLGLGPVSITIQFVDATSGLSAMSSVIQSLGARRIPLGHGSAFPAGTTFSVSGSIASYTSGGGTYTASGTLTATITLPSGSLPLDQILGSVILLGTTGSSSSDITQYPFAVVIPATAAPTTFISPALPAGLVCNLAIAFVDTAGNVTAAYPFATTVAQSAANGALPTMPAGASFTIGSVSTAVGDQGYLSSSGLGGSPTYDNPQITATCTIAESNTPAMAKWSGKPLWGIRVHSASSTTDATTYTWLAQSTKDAVGNGSVIIAAIPASAGDSYDIAVQIPDKNGSLCPSATTCVQVASNIAVAKVNNSGRIGPIFGKRNLLGDTSGDGVTAISDGTQFVHPMMSTGVQHNYNSGGDDLNGDLQSSKFQAPSGTDAAYQLVPSGIKWTKRSTTQSRTSGPFTAEVVFISGNGGPATECGLFVLANARTEDVDPTDAYLAEWSGTAANIYRRDNGTYRSIASVTVPAINDGFPHRIKVQVTTVSAQPYIDAWFDNAHIASADGTAGTNGYPATGYWGLRLQNGSLYVEDYWLQQGQDPVDLGFAGHVGVLPLTKTVADLTSANTAHDTANINGTLTTTMFDGTGALKTGIVLTSAIGSGGGPTPNDLAASLRSNSGSGGLKFTSADQNALAYANAPTAYSTNWDSAGALKTGKSTVFNAQASLLPIPNDFVLTYSYSAVNNNLTWWVGGGGVSGTNVTFDFPDGSTLAVAPTGLGTSGSPNTATGASAGQSYWALMYYNKTLASWSTTFNHGTSSTNPFTPATIAAAYGDGMVALISSYGSSSALSGGTAGSGGGGSAKGGGNRFL